MRTDRTEVHIMLYSVVVYGILYDRIVDYLVYTILYHSMIMYIIFCGQPRKENTAPQPERWEGPSVLSLVVLLLLVLLLLLLLLVVWRLID